MAGVETTDKIAKTGTPNFWDRTVAFFRQYWVLMVLIVLISAIVAGLMSWFTKHNPLKGDGGFFRMENKGTIRVQDGKVCTVTHVTGNCEPVAGEEKIVMKAAEGMACGDPSYLATKEAMKKEILAELNANANANANTGGANNA